MTRVIRTEYCKIVFVISQIKKSFSIAKYPRIWTGSKFCNIFLSVLRKEYCKIIADWWEIMRNKYSINSSKSLKLTSPFKQWCSLTLSLLGHLTHSYLGGGGGRYFHIPHLKFLLSIIAIVMYCFKTLRLYLKNRQKLKKCKNSKKSEFLSQTLNYWISNPYNFATRCRRPQIFQTIISVKSNLFKYQWFTPTKIF